MIASAPISSAWETILFVATARALPIMSVYSVNSPPRTNLTMADMFGAHLTKANLSKAILQGSDLRRADLMQADLSEADLREAKLSEANLMGANLKNAKVDLEELGKAIKEDTIFPDGSNVSVKSVK